MKYLLKTDTICSYNNNEPFPCTHMLLKHVDSKITAFLSSVLLCFCSFIVVNIPFIRFHMLYVYRQFYTCISRTSVLYAFLYALFVWFTYCLCCIYCVYIYTMYFSILSTKCFFITFPNITDV